MLHVANLDTWVRLGLVSTYFRKVCTELSLYRSMSMKWNGQQFHHFCFLLFLLFFLFLCLTPMNFTIYPVRTFGKCFQLAIVDTRRRCFLIRSVHMTLSVVDFCANVLFYRCGRRSLGRLLCSFLGSLTA